MQITEWQQDLARRMLAAPADDPAPVSVSADTGRVRSVEDRVQRIRTTERSGSRGSCHPGYTAWGD
ncbi:hypothetical protein [Streptomyces specialis]|uniref:hypothetical protein n=1 Tax=Streptomyces specialis TaxID=498367 RepID=UPI00073E40A5|nr:hypothetical protein [Streptomyces specialis]